MFDLFKKKTEQYIEINPNITNRILPKYSGNCLVGKHQNCYFHNAVFQFKCYCPCEGYKNNV